MNLSETNETFDFTYESIANKLNDKNSYTPTSCGYVFNPTFNVVENAIKEFLEEPITREVFLDSPYVHAKEVTLVNSLISQYSSNEPSLLNLFNFRNEPESIVGAFHNKMHELLEKYGIDITKDVSVQLAFAELRHNLLDFDARKEAFFIHLLALNEENHRKEIEELKEKYERTIRQNETFMKELVEARTDLEKKIKFLSGQLAQHGDKADTRRPFNYHYPTIMIETAILSVIYAKCGLRGAKKMLEIFNEVQSGTKWGRIPSHVTIGSWLHTAGYDIQEHNDKINLIKEGYHIIIDMSVSVGSQQLLLILAVPDKREWDHALTPKDVAIGFMKSAPHWKGEEVAAAIKKVTKKYGTKPSYCVSDGASNLANALGSLKIPHHNDIGHKFANYLKKVYGNCDDFKKWCKACGDTRRFYLSELGYMMAPGIRSKSRFMNIFIPALWSWKIIMNYSKFNRLEELGYAPILNHCSLVDEIMEIQTAYNKIFKLIKTRGLCQETYKRSIKIINYWICQGTQRQRELGDMLILYFTEEMKIVRDEEEDRIKAKETDVKVVHDISSDVIESMFGTMKRMMPDCKFFGITENVLSLNLYTVIAKPSDIHALRVEERLERSHFKDIFKWEGEFLCESLLAKRKEKLNTEKFYILQIA